jgi:ABC-type uncharacterized transport system fused permease/ATPase subunit
MLAARTLWRLSGGFFGTPAGAGLLLFTVVLCVANTVLNVWSVLLTREYLNALTSKLEDEFYSAVLKFALLVAIYVPFIAMYNYVLKRFAVSWRTWMINKFTEASLQRHYELFVLSNQLENVDSRIVDDIQVITDISSNLLDAVIGRVRTKKKS